VITSEGVAARLRRLERLTRGLALELVLVGEAQDPLLRLERQAYLAALRHALAGVESARVALARATVRLSTTPTTRKDGPDWG
jgi:hypothetical protein